LYANSSHAAFSLFVLVVQGMLYSNHGNAQEQKSTIPQVALKAACSCGATCLIGVYLNFTAREIILINQLSSAHGISVVCPREL
jgi:uncharacterized membrane protein